MSKRIVISEEDRKEILKKHGLINEQVTTEALDWFVDGTFDLEIDGNLNTLVIQNVDSDRNTEGKFYIYTKVKRTGERKGLKLFNDPNKSFCFDCDLKDAIYRYKNGTCLNSESYTKDDIKNDKDWDTDSGFLDNLYNYLCLHKEIK